mgnify:FL=1
MSPMSQYENECAAYFLNEKRTPVFHQSHNIGNGLTKQPFPVEVPL